ncbi:hypothetical protein PybrP1_002793 [[Pythium] brassicae (nom. inval.)]|nr:hypothetical protein PybrP1_002793 [[Pythium] brassicae (nom. inval.)]
MDAHFARVLADEQDDAPTPGASAAPPASSSRAAPTAALSQQQLDALVARADAQELDQLDARSLRTLVQALERRVRSNALARAKHADAPERFLESELALHSELARWRHVAAAPAALLPELAALNAAPLLLGLFAHDNADIRLDVLALLAELTDAEDDLADADALAARRVWVRALLEHRLLPLVVTSLEQLDSAPGVEDQDEEAAGVYHALQILENVADLEPPACAQLCATTVVLRQLLRQVAAARRFSANKLYASEVLSILLQSGAAPRAHFMAGTVATGTATAPRDDSDSSKRRKQAGAGDLLDRLLQAIAPYRKRNPASEDEEELVENLVNALCSVLLLPAAQMHFRRLEGLELALRCLKDRAQYVFSGALRMLDLALMGDARNCARLVEVGGLKALFAVFMGKKKAKKPTATATATTTRRAKSEAKAKEEELTMSILSSLCALLSPAAAHDVFDRFHAKFVENDMEKLDRVVDVFVKYLGRVEQRDLAGDDDSDDDDDNDEKDENEDARYLRRLDAGLFTLQRATHVLAHLCASSRKLRAYVLVKLHEHRIDMDVLAQILKEQLAMLRGGDSDSDGDGDGDKDVTDTDGERAKMQAQRTLLVHLLSTLQAPTSDAASSAVEPKQEEAKHET